jgi:hypothetical protein
MKKLLLALALCSSVHAQEPDPNKPVTHLLIMIQGDVTSNRPMVVQWWNDEDSCMKSGRQLNQKFSGTEKEFVCVRLVRESV